MSFHNGVGGGGTLKLVLLTSIFLVTFSTTVEGSRCCDPGTGGCCGTGYSVDCTCSQCCNIDEAAGVVGAIVITLAVGLPLFLIAGIALCCCFCPGCPGYKSRGSRRRRALQPIVIMHNTGVQNPGFYSGEAGNFNVPNNGQFPQHQYPPSGNFYKPFDSSAVQTPASAAAGAVSNPPSQDTQNPPPPPYSAIS